MKKTSSKKIEQGLKKQLAQYAKTSRYKNTFYVISCFNEEELNIANKVLSSYVYEESFTFYVEVFILDLRIREIASNLK